MLSVQKYISVKNKFRWPDDRETLIKYKRGKKTSFNRAVCDLVLFIKWNFCKYNCSDETRIPTTIQLPEKRIHALVATRY